jgi:hypothetical protein
MVLGAAGWATIKYCVLDVLVTALVRPGGAAVGV